MPQSTNIVNQFSNFLRTSGGLEKTLRLLQATAQIVTQVSLDNVNATRWGMAKSQFALTRRFFRFFNFIDCFARVIGLLGGSSSDGLIVMMIDLARFSCLGLYFLLEDLTILHAMNIYLVEWNKPVLVEAFKFWFYALSLSIIGALWQLAFSPASKPKGKGKKAGSDKASVATAQRNVLVKRIIVDGCDLLIPGAFLGWIEFGDLQVGIAMVLSTLLSGADIWSRAQ
ncbi:hypothetical protein FE257_011618 [Aspergillus nanangensis]|uniref:Uncharacterized protein n=1 Tax=Aspergillus nanangensis TaxID=2582783 RepID=A0AAD4CUY2_ASPNN|nr:hypothetical protein FE257_011618 [Aspergillus nanangensis]